MHTNIDVAEKDVGEIPEHLFMPTPTPELITIVNEDDSWE